MTIGNKGVGLRGACSLHERACRGFRLPAGCGYALSGFRPPGPGFAARTGYEQVSFAGWLRAGVRCANGAERRFRSPAGCGYALSGFRPPGPGFAARTGYEQVSFAGWLRQFQFRRCRRPTRGDNRRAPLTPGSGLLHRRFAVPSPLPDFSRTVGTRHPWHDPDSSRHPCRSS